MNEVSRIVLHEERSVAFLTDPISAKMQHIPPFYTEQTYIKHGIFQFFLSRSPFNTIKYFRRNKSLRLEEGSSDFDQRTILTDNMLTFVLDWVDRFMGFCENILQNFGL
jgi:hypothetical protein